MRVIAGKYRSRALEAPEGISVTRPTADRVRESLYNIIATSVPDANVLDLFSGSGALGIEALSRGAKRVVFVESHPAALRALRANLEKLRIPPTQAIVIAANVELLIDPAKRRTLMGWKEADFADAVDLVIADPPYASTWYHEAIDTLERSGLCGSACLAVLEMSSRKPASVRPRAPWELNDERTYGAARLEFWQRAEETHAADEPTPDS